MNDPNGFVFHDGVWHLFYQWCPWGAVHGLKYWYHTVSRDLVTWKNLGVCIRPDTEYDNKGAYSGSALPTADAVWLYYTGNHRDEDWTRKSYTCAVKLGDDGTGGLCIRYDDARKEITVDRSQMTKRFNIEQGEARTRPLPKGLFHLRIFIDRSSIEIFVNDGDAVFSSRIFPTPGEKRMFAYGDASIHLWELKRAVTDDFKIE